MNQFLIKKRLLLSAVLWITVSYPPIAGADNLPTPSIINSPNQAALANAFQITAYEKSFEPLGVAGQNHQEVDLRCVLKNLSEKEIHGVRGILQFTTLSGANITRQALESTAVIVPGQSISYTWKIPSDRFTAKGLKKFKNLKLDQMRQVWYPRMIVFTDGSILKE
jgi:hypothetical protein